MADRDAIAEVLTARLGMHVIERTDRFTLLGADARRGKVTLFAADGPREAGALQHIGLRVSSLPDGPTEVDAGEGLRFVLVEAPTDVEYDLDHVALVAADPDAAAEGWRRLGFEPAGRRRLEVGGAFLELHEGDPGDPERPLLNHVGVLVDSVEEHSRRPRARRRDRGRRRRAEHVGALRLGARARAARVRRAQADVLPDLSVTVVAGAGMAGLVAAARLRELGARRSCWRRATAPGGSMLLSSGVVWRHRELALPGRVPGRRPGAAGARLVAARRGTRWLESLGAPVVARETGNPDDGLRFDPRGLTEALVGRPGAFASAGARRAGGRRRPRDGRLGRALGARARPRAARGAVV